MHLAGRHRVTLATLIDDPADLRYVAPLASICREVRAVRLRRIPALARGAAGLARGRPLTPGYFRSRGLARWVRKRARRRPFFDAVVAFSSGMGPLAEGVPAGTARILDLVDLDSEKWRQYADASRGPAAWLYRTEASRLRRLEGRLLDRFQRTVVCTEPEARSLRELHPGCRVDVVRNGVNLRRFPFGPPAGRLPALVFTGAMDYRPNVDAVVHLCREILPLVQRERPGVEFWIVGRRPAPAVRALAARPGVRVTGGVEDVGGHLRRASVAVAPLRMARGIQNKILEAMASGTPVVASPVAFEGIEAAAGREVVVAGGPDRFARAILRLLGDPGERARLARAARARVEADYSWEASLERLEGILLEEVGERRAGR